MIRPQSLEFSVLTCNLRFGLADDGRNSWLYRNKAFPSFLKQYATDFVCFQEANDFQINYLQSLLPHYRYIGQRTPAPSFWQNNVVFYRDTWTCEIDHHFFLSPTPGIPSRMRLSRWPRQCTVGVFEQKGRRIICANTHFDFDSQVQKICAQFVLQQIDNLPSGLAAVLTGDFNTTPDSACHRVITSVSSDQNGDQTFHFSNVHQAPYPGTYHGWSGQPDGECIDWILHRGNLKLQDTCIIRNKFCGYYLSDHFPVRVTFAFSGNES